MPRRDVLLWIAIALPPLAWFADLTVSYAVTPEAYQRGSTAAMQVLTAAVVTVPVLGFLIGWTILMRLPGQDETTDRSVHRARAMAIAAIALSLTSLLLVIGTAVPKWTIPPGAEP